MSKEALLSDTQLNVFYNQFHKYLNYCKQNSLNPSFKKFFKDLRSSYPEFDQFENKQLENKIIAERRVHGRIEWPGLKNVGNYISPDVYSFLNKSRKNALLATEFYNKPALEYRTEGYIVFMNIAWNSLLHAIFLSQGKKIKYKAEKNNDDDKYFELGKCIKIYNGKLKKEITANLEFLISLRDKIVHKNIPDLDEEVFGECQACLLNFEHILVTNFGDEYRLKNSLAYSLQFSKVYKSEQTKSRKQYSLNTFSNIKSFINQYRDSLEPDIFQSPHYSFRVFMIPKVGNHLESSDLAVEFVKFNPDNSEQMNSYENFLVAIKERRISGNYYKAGEVAKEVYEKLSKDKPKNWKFSASYHHAKCAKYFKIRPGYYGGDPENTNKKYCIYDKVFEKHIYTKEWITFLTKKLKDDSVYKKIMKSN